MRILYCGDVLGRSGREAIGRHLPELRRQLDLDFVLVNGENAAAGFGITAKIAAELYGYGADAICLGNHAFDQKDVLLTIDQDPKMIRPANYPATTPGRGFASFSVRHGYKIFVVQVMGRVFMEPLDCPFMAVDKALTGINLGRSHQAVLIDIHGEASSEKMAMAFHADGRASLVAGTHTHIPTADHQIFPQGCAYVSDVGMCGDYLSVIGMQKDEPLRRFLRKINSGRHQPAEGEGTLCAVFLETDDVSGKAIRVEPVRVGPRLANIIPKP